VLTHSVNGDGAKAKFGDVLLSIEIPTKKILKGKKVPIEWNAPCSPLFLFRLRKNRIVS
jgi:hypothetical protein